MKYVFPEELPESPGVYLFRDRAGEILYIGKAANLKRRVSSYFQKSHDRRIEQLVSEIDHVDVRRTETVLEALILEASLIKQHLPRYNIREKDDKSFLYVEITREAFPRVLLARGREALRQARGANYGPFTSGASIREALRILRKIFPYATHPSPTTPDDPLLATARPCFDYQLGHCPGTCISAISRTDYRKHISRIELFFEGKKQRIIRALEREMAAASRKLEFERAAELKRKIFALKHIQDVALITDEQLETRNLKRKRGIRIEGYDISNISGTSATGSMVVFLDGQPDTSEYRKFRIRTITRSNDVAMLREVLRRRLAHAEWSLPSLFLIDGGKPQVNAARAVLEAHGFRIPVVGIAKGPERRKNEFIGAIPRRIEPETLIRVRDEAHRFAVCYHRTLRSQRMF